MPAFTAAGAALAADAAAGAPGAVLTRDTSGSIRAAAGGAMAGCAARFDAPRASAACAFSRRRTAAASRTPPKPITSSTAPATTDTNWPNDDNCGERTASSHTSITTPVSQFTCPTARATPAVRSPLNAACTDSHASPRSAMPNAWPTIAGSTVTSCSASYSAFHGVSTNSTPNAASSTASIRRTARSNGFIGDQST
ncbi:Uncharacterised protein [Burkholderia pseudomallei]|nr:Uncharacterised protein [Burkholderia pseudomallei]